MKEETQSYDVIVIGGGITGAAISRDLALRGLSCLLLEKSDFASGTSSKSGKLIHGGLRYLKKFQIKMVFESCKERFYLNKIIAPHLVSPVNFHLPFYSFSKTPFLLALPGIILYYLLSLFKGLGPPRVLREKELKRKMRFLKTDWRGALIFKDAKGMDFRLVIDTLRSFVNAGGLALNYHEVLKIQKEESLYKITGFNKIKKENFTFYSQTLVNASGAWVDDILERGSFDFRFQLTMTSGIHLYFKKERFPLEEVLGIEAKKDQRPLYFVPWGDLILVGTTDRFYEGRIDNLKVSDDDVNYLLETISFYFPSLSIEKSDIVYKTIGVRPLVGEEGKLKKASDISRDYEIHIDQKGMVSITGGKLTTHRSMAEKVCDELIQHFFQKKKNLLPCRTISPLLREDDTHPSLFDLDENTVRHFCKYEFVKNLDDILFRRTFLGHSLKSLKEETIKNVASILKEELCLSEEEIEKQLNKVRDEKNSYV